MKEGGETIGERLARQPSHILKNGTLVEQVATEEKLDTTRGDLASVRAALAALERKLNENEIEIDDLRVRMSDTTLETTPIAGPSEALRVTPDIHFSSGFSGLSLPGIDISTDHEGVRFRHEAELSVPNLLYLLDRRNGYADLTHLVIDVWSEFFAAHHDWEYEVAIELDGAAFDRRLFHKWYGRHQFLIPISSFGGDLHRLSLRAKPSRVGAVNFDEIIFTLAPGLTSKPELWQTFERSAIWIFSAPRSGSTWLAMDVLCADERARGVDESGLGRMFAPLQWDAERFFDPISRANPIENGFAYECGTTQRKEDALPLFERVFRNLNLENQILSRHNFEFYHRMLRDIALEHVLNEWGMLDIPRLVFKMPNDSHGADFIMRAFPNSHMVFVMRDGRDVMRSRFSPFASRILAETDDRELRKYAIAFYSHFWNFQVDIIRNAFDAHARERRSFLRYEDIRENPVPHFTKLYAQLGLDATHEQILRLSETTRLENMPAEERGPDKPRQTGLIGGFRQVFDTDEIALMNSIMRPNLIKYGYRLED